MAIRKIKTYPDDVLRKKAIPVDNFTGETNTLIDEMIETMYSASGVGLAAPQVGESSRIIVIDSSWRENGQPLIVIINPEIVEAQGIIDSEEGCLSVPKHLATIKRAENIVVQGYDRDEKPVAMECSGLLARVVQHEIDHLDGILFFDHLGSIKKEFFKRKYLKSIGLR
jgi:peptide deformylase